MLNVETLEIMMIMKTATEALTIKNSRNNRGVVVGEKRGEEGGGGGEEDTCGMIGVRTRGIKCRGRGGREEEKNFVLVERVKRKTREKRR